MVALDSRCLRKALIMVVLAIIGLQIVNYAWGLLGGFLFNLLIAWLIAISFDPIVSYLAHRGMRRGLATALVAFTTLALLGLFIALFGGVLATQIVELVQALPSLVLDIVDWVNRTFNAEIDPERLLDNLNLTARADHRHRLVARRRHPRRSSSGSWAPSSTSSRSWCSRSTSPRTRLASSGSSPRG